MEDPPSLYIHEKAKERQEVGAEDGIADVSHDESPCEGAAQPQVQRGRRRASSLLTS